MSGQADVAVQRLPSRLAVVAVLLSLVASPAQAGGPFGVAFNGSPFRWPNGGRGITFATDQGPLGTLTNAEAVAFTEAAFPAWEAVPTAPPAFVNTGSLPFDVDATNFGPILFGLEGSNHPVVFDADGSLLLLLGVPAIGLTVPTVNLDTGEILHSAVILGPLIPLFGLTVTEIAVHEIGHSLGPSPRFVGIRGFALVRYHADGSLDTAFGDEGRVTTSFGPETFGGGTNLALYPDGGIIVAGATDGDFALARYLGRSTPQE